MESNGKTIAVIGSRGALAPFVIGALGSAGFKVVTDNHSILRKGPYLGADLSQRGEAGWIVGKWERPIDGLVALTGRYEPVSDAHSFVFDMVLRHNIMPVVNVVDLLKADLRKARGPVIAINAADTVAQPGEGAYRAGKAALDAYLRTLSMEESAIDVSYIAPAGSIDTDEKRNSLAALIVSLVKQTFERSNE